VVTLQMENDMLFRPKKKKEVREKCKIKKKDQKRGYICKKKQKKAKTNLVKFAPVESAK
jgi:hypothetical protein